MDCLHETQYRLTLNAKHECLDLLPSLHCICCKLSGGGWSDMDSKVHGLIEVTKQPRGSLPMFYGWAMHELNKSIN